MEKAFGHVLWTHLLGAFALIHTAASAVEGVFAETAASSAAQNAAMSGSLDGIVSAHHRLAEADEQMMRTIPVIGPMIAGLSHHWNEATDSVENTARASKVDAIHAEETEKAVHEYEQQYNQWKSVAAQRNSGLLNAINGGVVMPANSDAL